MYCDFYRVTERPFNVTPDPKFLYLNARYREAIASLHYGITQRRGFISLIGEAGTGKTTLLKRLLDDLDDKTKSVFVFNTNVSFEEILEYILAEFDLPVHNGKKLYMLQRLNTFLLEELRRGCNVALLIDEAQDLEFSVLEDLRLLSNLETAKEKILQIVLSGQPELGQKLSNPVLRQLRQRISINCRLLPLSREEVTDYIEFRLQAAGSPDVKLFTREAEDQIYRFSRGVPRLVNVVCDNALVIGYALGQKRIGADVVREAAADLMSVQDDETAPIEVHGDPASGTAAAPAPAPRVRRWRPSAILAGAALVAVLIGLFSVGRTLLSGNAGEDRLVAQGGAPLEVIRPGSWPRGGGVDVPQVSTAPSGSEQQSERPPPAMEAPRVVAVAPSDEAETAAAPAAPPAPALRAEWDASSAPVERPDAEPAAAWSEGGAVEPSGFGNEWPRSGEGTAPKAPGTETREDAGGVQMVDAAGAAAPERVGATGGTGSDPVGAAEPSRSSEQEPAPAPVVVAAVAPTDARWEGDETEHDVFRALEEEDVTPAPAETLRLDGVKLATTIVEPGDSVSALALREYGQASPTILTLLKLANPRLSDVDLIVVGQKIQLPQLGDGFPVLNDGSGQYSLLVWSTYGQQSADALRDQLRTRGYDARVSVGTLGTGKVTYRVLVSGFRSREDVSEAGMRLQRLFREEGAVAQLVR